MKRAKPFATEAAMCARFIASIGDDWTSYAECNGWDILLVRKADGFQIGIEAKLRLNTDVISQALEEYGAFYANHTGPDCRAILVPHTEPGGFSRICEYIGLTIIYVRSAADVEEAGNKNWGYKPNVFEPQLPGEKHGDNNRWFEWAPGKRHTLPDYVPDVVAGSPSPIQLTSWKIAAIKISIILEKRGYLMRSDFKHINIDHRRWLPSGAGWLIIRDGVYVQSMGYPDFRKQHPRVYEEIAADYEAWKPADSDAPPPQPQPKQETML